ncbi:MAG TPA: hypothetical protein VFQ77_08520 [Pseudonocardiaceae bacterium]|jgi:hypothetical protein|nr:hypothetical protein [Pseudonocardiaceae bacterium]
MIPTEPARPARVVIPDPAAPPLRLVLTCGSRRCGQTFEPDPVAFAVGELGCPRCSGWVFTAEVIDPDAPIRYRLTRLSGGGS